MTEDQARDKWCPFVRTVLDDGLAYPTGNRFGNDERYNSQCRCIASYCMAWRSTNWEHRDTMEESRGYCGLAGKP